MFGSRFSWILYSSVVVAAFGCAQRVSAETTPSPPSIAQHAAAHRVPKDGTAPDVDARTAVDPEGVVTLREALALALTHNPELAAFSWEVRVREGLALQAGLRPNPTLQIEVENVGGSGAIRGADAAETTVWLGQLVELAGKRLKRRRVATLEQELAGWDYETKRLDVFTTVVRAFVAVLAVQERLALAEDLQRVAERSVVAVGEQVEAGAASAVERTRAEVAATTVRVTRERTVAELDAARARLAATWGGRGATYERVEGDLFAVVDPPGLDPLVERMVQNPDLVRWVQELELRRATVALAEARRIPNVTVAGGYRRLSELDDNALVFGLSVPLPVYDRNQGALLAARRDLSKARSQSTAATVRVRAALTDGYQQLRASHLEATALRDEIIPRAESAFTGTRDGYLRGLFRYVEVLDAQRTLFELRTRRLDALESYHLAVAEIERLTGEPLGAPPEAQDTVGRK